MSRSFQLPEQGKRKCLRRLPVYQQMVPGEKEASSTKPQQMHNFYANISQSITRKGPGTHVNMNKFTAIKSRRELRGGDSDSVAPPPHFTRSDPVGSVIKSFSLLQSRSIWATLTAQRLLGTLWGSNPSLGGEGQPRFLTSADMTVCFCYNLVITEFKQRESYNQTRQLIHGTVVRSPESSFAFVSSQMTDPQNYPP